MSSDSLVGGVSYFRTRVADFLFRQHGLFCLGSWSLMGLVRSEDVKAIALPDKIQGKFELEKLGELLTIRA